MGTIKLKWDPKSMTFCTEEAIPRELLVVMKEKGYIPSILPELFPESIACQTVLDVFECASPKHHVVSFYTGIKTTGDMQKKGNEDVMLDCEEIYFDVVIPKQGSILIEQGENISLCY